MNAKPMYWVPPPITAPREVCEASIKSRAHEGRRPDPDDDHGGGRSGPPAAGLLMGEAHPTPCNGRTIKLIARVQIRFPTKI